MANYALFGAHPSGLSDSDSVSFIAFELFYNYVNRS